MKTLQFNILMLSVCALFIFGCSPTFDKRYKTHTPPGTQPRTGTYDSKTHPPTQRPYKIAGIQYTPIPSADGFVQTGLASWYGKKFHGRKTSNGETYNMYAMTAAHKTLPMNTWVSVHNLENNRKIVVRINDRGPFVTGRIIDLSYTGAKEIGILGPGTAKVRVSALGQATAYSSQTKQPTTFKAVDYWKGNFTVQVGAFQIKANAEKYREKLSKNYTNAHITTFTDDRGTFYRVRIGRFGNLKDADDFTETLMTQGFGSAFIVAEE